MSAKADTPGALLHDTFCISHPFPRYPVVRFIPNMRCATEWGLMVSPTQLSLAATSGSSGRLLARARRPLLRRAPVFCRH